MPEQVDDTGAVLNTIYCSCPRSVILIALFTCANTALESHVPIRYVCTVHSVITFFTMLMLRVALKTT